MLASAGVLFLKIASPEIHDLPLIRHAASTGLPLVISTGMATVAGADRAGSGARKRARDVCMSLRLPLSNAAGAREPKDDARSGGASVHTRWAVRP